MLAVVLIWIYVIITTYLLGYAFISSLVSLDCMHLLKGKAGKKYEPRYRESYIVSGIVICTVYAQLFSLAAGVGLIANILLVLICVVIAVYYRNELLEDFFVLLRRMTSNRNGLYYLLIFLLMAYGTAHGIMHYDSDLYHAQAIHWIEDYGVVKGLGNLHVRLAYNSSSFALSALFSMSFLTGKSYHVMAGFFALLLAWQCLDLKNIVRRGHFVLSDFARIMAIYYLFTIFDEMVAPASDYFLSTIVFYIIIHWLDMNIKHEHSYVPYILLALAGIYAVTIKLSAAPMVLFTIIPIYMLFHNKTKEKMRAFGVSVVMAMIIVIPFFVRNILISGWLIYPVTALDFFNSEWKIPQGVAAYDAKEIRTFGRGYTDVAQYGDLHLNEWIGHWFTSMGLTDKLMLILDIIAIVIYLCCLIYFLAGAIGERKNLKFKISKDKVVKLSHRSMVRYVDFLAAGGTMILCLVFWLFSAPLIRYGVVYVYLTFAIVFGRMLILLINKFGHDKKGAEWFLKGFVVLLSVWLLYKGGRLVIDDVKHFNAAYLLDQQDYGSYEVATFEIGDTTFYYPTESDRIGYYPFPSAPYDVSGKVGFIGNGFADGLKEISED